MALKIGSIHMKCSMTGQEKGDILIQVTHGQVCLYIYIDILRLQKEANSS
jgi:hypothetical protein